MINMSAILSHRGHKVVVACSENNTQYFVEKNIKTYPLLLGAKLGKRNVLQMVLAPLMIAYLIGVIYYIKRRENIDLIYATYKKEQVIGTIAAKLLRIPMVWREAGGLPSPIPDRKVWRLLYCWFANRAFKIIATSKTALDSLLEVGVQPERISLIYTGIDLNSYSCPTQPGGGERPTIGIVGRLSVIKGHDLLIKAMASVVEEIPNVLLLIIGDGPNLQMIKNMVSDLNIDANVEFVGHVSDVVPYLSRLDVFILPSVMEGLPIAIIEAIACGLPVIASNVAGIPDIVIDGKTGLLLQERSPEQTSKAILTLLKDKELARKMGKQARQHAQKKFSSERWILEIENLFIEAIETT